MPFHLTELQLHASENFENLATFLVQQSKTLKRLRLVVADIPDSVYELVFAEMLELDTIYLYMPKNKELFERLVEHRGIDTVVIMRSRNINCKFIPNLLEKMPNVRHLTVMETCDNEAYVAMAHCLPRLETFAIKYLKNDAFRGVRFRCLEALKVDQLCAKIDWHEFAESHSQLTDLNIDYVDQGCLSNDDIDKIASRVNLKSLTLGHSFVPDKRFFEIILNKCHDLKVLDLCTRSQHISREIEDVMNCFSLDSKTKFRMKTSFR